MVLFSVIHFISAVALLILELFFLLPWGSPYSSPPNTHYFFPFQFIAIGVVFFFCHLFISLSLSKILASSLLWFFQLLSFFGLPSFSIIILPSFLLPHSTTVFLKSSPLYSFSHTYTPLVFSPFLRFSLSPSHPPVLYIV